MLPFLYSLFGWGQGAKRAVPIYRIFPLFGLFDSGHRMPLQTRTTFTRTYASRLYTLTFDMFALLLCATLISRARFSFYLLIGFLTLLRRVNGFYLDNSHKLAFLQWEALWLYQSEHPLLIYNFYRILHLPSLFPLKQL